MEAGKGEVRQTQERGHREYLGDKSMDKWEGQSQRKGNSRDGGREGRGDADPGSGLENEGDTYPGNTILRLHRGMNNSAMYL